MDTELLKRITLNPDIFNLKPIIIVIRLKVTDLLNYLSSGSAAKEIVANFPYLEKKILSLHFCMLQKN